MFHISNDKRAIDSALQLRMALERLVMNRPFDAISISLICAEAKVSRTTFYRLFDTTTDIIHWYCDQQSKQMCQSLLQQSEGVQQSPFRFNLRYVLQHPESLELAYRVGRIDIADAAFHRNISPILDELHRAHQLSDIDTRISGALASAIITSAFRVWFESGKKEPVDVFHDRLIRCLKTIQ